MPLSAQSIIDLLNLKPHGTCGYMGETFVSDLRIPAEALPADYAGSRPLGNVYYFLVTPDARVHLHRIRSDQMYHHYLGEPLEVLLLYPNGTSEVRIVGPDLTDERCRTRQHVHGPERLRMRLTRTTTCQERMLFLYVL